MNEEKFHRAAKDGYLDILRSATKKDLNTSDEDGMTPTHYAAAYGNLDALRMIMGRSGDPDRCDLQGFTSLHHACKNGNMNIVSYLVNFGCNIWALDNEYHSALEIASLGDRADIVAFLDGTQSKQQQKNPKMVQSLQYKATKDAEQNIKRMERRQKEAARYAEKEQRRIQEQMDPDFKAPTKKNFFKTLTTKMKPKSNERKYSSAGNTSFSQIAQPSKRGVPKKIMQKQASQDTTTQNDFRVSEMDEHGKRTLRSLAGTAGVRKGSDIMYLTNRETDGSEAIRKPLSGVFPGLNGISPYKSKWKSESDLLDSGVDSIGSTNYDYDEEEKPGIFVRPGMGQMSFFHSRPGLSGTLHAMGRSNSADMLDSLDQGFGDEVDSTRSGDTVTNRRSGSSDSIGNADDLDDVKNLPWNPETVCSEDEDDEEDPISELIRFLEACDMSQYIHLFTDQEVDLSSLINLSDDDLEKLGLKLGPRRKLQRAIKKRQDILSNPSAIKDTYL